MTFRAPDPDHPVYGPYWRPASDGCLNLPACAQCHTVLWPPTELCPDCLGGDVTWSEQPGDGVVWSVAEYHRAYSTALAEEVPYTCVLVELDCGPQMIARFVGSTGAAVPGQRVGVARVATDDDQSVPCFVESSAVSSSR